MNTGILKAEGLCKSYGSKRVLEGLDLTIQPGQDLWADRTKRGG